MPVGTSTIYEIPSSLLLLGIALETKPVKEVLIDEDIPPKERLRFNGEARAKSRENWPDSLISDKYPKHHPSKKEDLIQVADIIAYVLQRENEGRSGTPELKRLAQKLWRKDGNRIWRGRGSDLQPYL